MLTVLLEMVLAGLPYAVIAGLLAVASRLQARRAADVARQIALTDAIGRELGAVVAPVVESRRGGARDVRIAVPFERAALVARVLAITTQALREDGDAPGGWRIVLTPQEPARRPLPRGGPVPAIARAA